MRWWFFCFLCRQDHWDGFCHFLDIRKKHTLLSYYTHYYWLLIYRQSVSSTNNWGWCVSWSVLSRSALLLRCPPPLHSAPSPRPPGPHPVCGGHTTATYTRCFTLTGSGWQESHQLQERRYDHSSWRSPAGLLLMGGYYSLTSTEILSQAPHPASHWNTGHSEYIVISVRLAYCLQSRPIYPNVVRTLVSLPLLKKRYFGSMN